MNKKSLLLLPLVGLCGAAFAQSSVTLFGVVDATLAFGRGSIADRTQLTRGGYNSNRLGFRGVEDLGGGLSASFHLEAGLNVDDGEGAATNSNNQASGAGAAVAGRQGLTFNRRSTVSLSGRNWGELRLGRDFTPAYWNNVFGDPFGNVGVGAAVSYTASIAGVTNTRVSNSIGYLTPAGLGGFGAQIAYYMGEQLNNAAGGTSDDGDGWAIRGTYDKGPLGLGAGYGRTQYAAGDIVMRNLNASYNFGVAKLMSTYNDDRNGAIKARGWVLGVVVPVGAGEAKASYSEHTVRVAGPDPKAKQIAVGYVHHLSKRTSLYTTYAHISNSNGSARALNGGLTAGGRSASGLAIGLRHAF
ncbi:porin [Ramlibacter sp.]|uniref:porin n=1 Tax=Ramlibacter sp. TaxID=1917967 RepID=UPI003D110A07